MASLYTQQSKNVWRTWLLMAVFLALVAAVGTIAWRSLSHLAHEFRPADALARAGDECDALVHGDVPARLVAGERPKKSPRVVPRG